MRLLLISNSTNAGEPYLSYPLPYIGSFLAGVREVAFVPYAAVTFSYAEYERRVQERFSTLGIRVRSVHRAADPAAAIRRAPAICVGGGNTFALAKKMQEQGLMSAIRSRVRAGVPYVGWSAGSNVACPTICTTNDMPIAEPPSFNTFGFCPFQTNPHFISGGTAGLNNETREDRLEEFLAYNRDEEVIGLPEGTALFITGEFNCEVLGPKDAEPLYWFRQPEKKFGKMKLERIALGTKFDVRNVVPGGKL